MSDRDIYQEVTDRIVTALEQGTVPWIRPWSEDKHGYAALPHNATTGRPYHGINGWLLYFAPYESKGWLTFNQARSLGGTVRKGEKGTTIIFWKQLRVKDKDDAEKTKRIPLLRYYTVFNVDQCDGIEASKIKQPPAPPKPIDTSILALAKRVGARVSHGGDRAFYAPLVDAIQVPHQDQFKNQAHYDATLAHELTHWTGHRSRCNRDLLNRFGEDAYAFEELIAEIGAAYICAHHNVPHEELRHSEYIATWLRVLKGDKKAVFTAASKARIATEFLIGKPAEESEEEEEETQQKAA